MLQQQMDFKIDITTNSIFITKCNQTYLIGSSTEG